MKVVESWNEREIVTASRGLACSVSDRYSD